ncbi:GNAT family N-acetyltransferase [Amycolatopsis sp. FU40]|uniref:GNAT family N-acetyltransferase n=1 Tax=Amycolatopsis sp. FU40 TaxID=2914159 RepID=UPI001F196338|nr:GNAT family N-acetyltransferase [Amycolatopsis sp. FU40]UKD54497.1 GNAT family N-acetyltransferase [Amycolatopsis sp. FU40]
MVESLPDLIRRWQAGWGTSRGFRPAGETRGGLHVLLEQPDRHREVIALSAEPDILRGLAEEVAAAERPTWLTVPTNRPEEVAAIVREAGLKLRDAREALMTIPLRQHPPRPAPPPYTGATTMNGAVCETVLRHPGSGVAARGTMAVVGADAIADRIETVPEHRRRGLGSVVMSSLAENVMAHGATTGILIATADGRQLYSALGWSTRATVLIAQSPAG